MTKITLTAEQGKAMEAILAKVADVSENGVYETKATVITAKMNGWSFFDERSGANSLSNTDFITALYEGYETPKTNEDTLLEQYNRAKNLGLSDTTPFSSNSAIYSQAFRDGIDYVLDTLDIEVEGINKHTF